MTTAATPLEQTQPASGTLLPIASLGRRLLAALVDACVVIALAMALLGILWLAVGGAFSTEAGISATINDGMTRGQVLRTGLEFFIVQATWVIYAAVMTARRGSWNGQTLGKRAAGVRVSSPDGSPVSAGQAWGRTLLVALLLGGLTTVGALVDGLTNNPPQASDIFAFIGAVTGIVAVAFVLFGGRRQFLYDRLAHTIVVDLGAATGPGTEPAVASVPGADGQPTFTQRPALEEIAGPVEIVPRPATWKTWAVIIAFALVLLFNAGMTQVDLPDESGRAEILELPETKDALDRARRIEALAAACLDTTGAAEECDEPGELGFPDDEFVYDFDIEQDEIGAHAGLASAVADGDDTVIIYAFTSADRIWSSIVETDDQTSRVCIKGSGGLCDGVFDW